MSYSLTVKPAAEGDIFEAYLWYEKKHIGLGELFLESIEAVFDRILEHPRVYQEVATEIRRGVTHTFPYCVFYTIENTDVIVLAIVDARQDPDYIKSRFDA